MTIQKIVSDGTIISIIVPKKYKGSGVDFITSSESPFQLAIINNDKGTETKKHYHPDIKRTIMKTTECIIVKKGKLEISFFNKNKELITVFEANKGDIILFLEGGHSINYLEKSEIVEVRQGPYIKDFDKVYF